jgi:hypothetical protein
LPAFSHVVLLYALSSSVEHSSPQLGSAPTCDSP